MPGYTPQQQFEDGSGFFTAPDGSVYMRDAESGNYVPWVGPTDAGGGGYADYSQAPAGTVGPMAASEPAGGMMDVGGWDTMGGGGLGRKTYQPGDPGVGTASPTALGVYGQLYKTGKQQGNAELMGRADQFAAMGAPVAAANPAQALLEGMGPQGLPGFPPAEDPNAGPQLPTVNNFANTPPPPPAPAPGAPGSRRRLDRAPAYGSQSYGAPPVGGPSTVAGTYGTRLLQAGRRLRGRA